MKGLKDPTTTARPSESVLELLGCPLCGHRLEEARRTVRCTGCGHSWDANAGTYVFEHAPACGGPVPREVMRECLARCTSGPWRDVLRHEFESVWRLATNITMADWQFLLPLTAESCVLVLRDPLGASTFEMASRSKTVFVVENTPEYRRFLEMRKRQDRIPNVFIMAADLRHVPFRPGVLDVVICSGVPGGSGIKRTRPRRHIQEEFLQGLSRILKPNGSLMLATTARGRRGYTQRLLQASGFAAVRTYAAEPDYRRPWNLIPLDNPWPRRYAIRRKPRKYAWVQVASQLGLHAIEAFLRNLLVAHIVVTARKGKR